jgi:FAD/FMN-containing dehydrogenase
MTSTLDWDRLRHGIQGDVVLPADPAYPAAKQLADMRFDKVSPRALVFCQSAQDVQATLRFARDHDVHTVVRSGGHSTAGYSTTDGMVLDVSRLNKVSVSGGVVTMGPGVQAVDACQALAPKGLAVPNGFCPTVSAGGFLTGGGFGLLSRSIGMGCDRIRSAEVVLADGRIVRASRFTERDLFWAIRGGGGGNFGVITSYEVDPLPITHAVNFSVVWTFDAAADVLRSWQHWAPTAPTGLTSWMGIFLNDASPGQVAQVVVFGLWQGTEDALVPELAKLTAGVAAPPLVTDHHTLPYQAAMMEWWFCGDKTVDQCHRVGVGGGVMPRTPFQTLRGRFFSRPMSDAAISEFLTAFDADRTPGQGRVSLSAAVAGQVNALHRTETAYVHRTSLFHLDFTSTLHSPTPTAEELAKAQAWASNGFTVLDRYGNHESYQNYTDPLLRDWQLAYYAENYPRLQLVKRRYDPHNFFRFDQGISGGLFPHTATAPVEAGTV